MVDAESDARGFARTRLRWPRSRTGARPPLLGGAVAELTLPDAAAWDIISKTLTAVPCGDAEGTDGIDGDVDDHHESGDLDDDLDDDGGETDEVGADNGVTRAEETASPSATAAGNRRDVAGRDGAGAPAAHPVGAHALPRRTAPLSPERALRPGSEATRGGTPMIAIDTETTGVGHNSGTIAFLIGAAWFVGDELVVEQWTLTRLSAEAAMLRSFAARLDELAGPSTVLLSYNGASFDLPLLEARCRRARVECATLGASHIDLLLPARRLWREVEPDCRLSTLERSRLGVVRRDDIAGHEIPDAFWRWLGEPEGEAAARIEQVRVHNQVDLLTLPALAAEIAAVIRAPGGPAEALRVARLEVARGDRPAALRALEAWLPELGEPGETALLRDLLAPFDTPAVASGVERRGAAPPPTKAARRSAGAQEMPRAHALGGLGERMARLGVVAPGQGREPGLTRLRSGDRQPLRATGPQRREAPAIIAPPPAGKPEASAPLAPEVRQVWGLAAKLLRRGGDDARSAVLWARICLRAPGDPEAHEGLAKLLEHRLGELLRSGGPSGWTRAQTLASALAVTRASSAPCPRRLARLRHKLAKHSRAVPDSVYG